MTDNIYTFVHDNNNAALIPQIWANEALMVLDDSLVLGGLINRQYEDLVAEYGDTVNCHRPAKFVGRRKGSGDVSIQDATVANVPVKLDQHIHVSFTLSDRDLSLSMKNLVELYLTPALRGQARFIDQAIGNQIYALGAGRGYGVGKLDAALNASTIGAARGALDKKFVPQEDRFLVVTPDATTDILADAQLTSAQVVGDGGAAMKEAVLGKRFGFNIFQSTLLPTVTDAAAAWTGVNTNTEDKGATAIEITSGPATGVIVAGTWVVINGLPYIVDSLTAANGNTTVINLASPGLTVAVPAGSVVTAVAGTTASASWTANATDIVDIPIAGTAHRGQGVNIAGNLYGAQDTIGANGLVTNRPHGSNIANGATIGLGPNGCIGMAGYKNGIGLITRPLMLPMTNAVNSAVASFNNLALRVTIAYLAQQQKHLVTVDSLMGLATFDSDMILPVYSKQK